MISLRRPVTSYAKVQTWVGNLLRNRAFQLRRVRGRSPKYLDVGCGRNTPAQFINVDYLWHPLVDVCWDVTRGLPFAGGEVRGIFSEHCLEHFPLPVAADLLKEFRRVLSPGGTVRIVVPDAELYLRTYCAQRDGGTSPKFPFQDVESFRDIWSPVLSVNRIFYQNRDSAFGHRFIYDAHLLCALLRHCGFEWVEKVDFKRGRDPVLLVDTESRRCESLYVEAGIV